MGRKEGSAVSLWPVRVRGESLPEGKMLPSHGVRVSRTQGGSPWELLILRSSPVGEGAMVKVVSSPNDIFLLLSSLVWFMGNEGSGSFHQPFGHHNRAESRGPRLSLPSGVLERPSPATDTLIVPRSRSSVLTHVWSSFSTPLSVFVPPPQSHNFCCK